MKRIVLLAVVLTAGAVAFFRLAPESGADAPAYRTAAAERGEFIATVAASGTLNAVVLVDVGSQISGQISELYADFNSAVTQDQVIARIDPGTYEAKLAQAEADLEIARAQVEAQGAQIERARADVENARAAHAAAKAQTARAELALDDARRDLERKRSLVSSAVVSASDWEKIQNGHRSAQAQAEAARAQQSQQNWELRAAEAALRVAEAQLINNRALVKHKEAAVRQAQTDLERTYIRAPVTGTVINRSVSQGQTVAASLQAPTLFTIAQDLTRMQVHASVVEADVGRMAVGQRATFTVDAHPGRLFTGEVAQIRMAPQVVQNVVTYIVVISVENADAALFPGMTANLRIVVAEKDGILRVPNAALRFRPADAPALDVNPGSSAGPGVPGRVFVLGPAGQPIEVPLRLGATDGRMTEVLTGELTAGEAVITGAARATARVGRTSWIPAKLRLL